jgi:hypothetical protein
MPIKSIGVFVFLLSCIQRNVATRNLNKSNQKASKDVLYRMDPASQFQNLKEARKAHEQSKADKERREKKTLPKRKPVARDFDHVLRQEWRAHFKGLVQPGDVLELPYACVQAAGVLSHLHAALETPAAANAGASAGPDTDEMDVYQADGSCTTGAEHPSHVYAVVVIPDPSKLQLPSWHS